MLLSAASGNENQIRGLNHLFGEVERNLSSVRVRLEVDVAKLAGGSDSLRGLRKQLATAEASRSHKAAAAIELQLARVQLRAANRRYEEVLSSIDEFMGEHQRLAAFDFSATDEAALLTGAPAELSKFKKSGSSTAYGRALKVMEYRLSRARKLREAGKNAEADVHLAKADALREEWLGQIAGQIRNRQGQALFYASEAYQTEGAIRHVVGELQNPSARPGGMESSRRKGLAPDQYVGACPDRQTASHFGGTCSNGRKVTIESLSKPRVPSETTPEQYMDSFYENRANMYKEMNHQLPEGATAYAYPEKAAEKTAKYFIRQLDAARPIRYCAIPKIL